MNKVLLTGRLTRDPELRSLASGSSVATFAVATNEFRGNGKERAEYHNVVVWVYRPLSPITRGRAGVSSSGRRLILLKSQERSGNRGDGDGSLPV